MSRTVSDPVKEFSAARLTGMYFLTGAWYVLAVWILWRLGFESIHGHPTPFYALAIKAFTSSATPGIIVLTMGLITASWLRRAGATQGLVSKTMAGAFALTAAYVVASVVMEWRRHSDPHPLLADAPLFMWHGLALGFFVLALAALDRRLSTIDWFGEGPTDRQTTQIIIALVVFAFVFPAVIAMLRGGLDGISRAYERHTYEYVNDIGIGGSIRGLFAEYNDKHAYLSMHAKVHPPGPIAILWFLSYFFGRTSLGLSLATMSMGATSVVPLYLWIKDMTQRRVALTVCMLYVTVPTIVLFTATSADITFMPFTLTTLFLFWRAISRQSVRYALAAGALYAFVSLISFSLISLGAFFGFTGLWKLAAKETRWTVIQTAGVMLVSFVATHLAVRLWSGFDVVACFELARAQFVEDQANLDMIMPRFPGWCFRLLNPACWFFFAGIPVSVLFVWRILKPRTSHRALFRVVTLSLVAFDILYLARGEGERSAMYIIPFLALPAGHLLDEAGQSIRSHAPLVATVAFLGFQCWCIESFLFTYW